MKKAFRVNDSIETRFLFQENVAQVRMRGFEPPRDYLPLDPESSASANSATSANRISVPLIDWIGCIVIGRV